jgi:O-antigen/teichoic acid export membrane protein
LRRLYNSSLEYFNKYLPASLTGVIKAAIHVSPLSIIRLACGFLRSKIAAVVVGVAGVGVLGQANQYLLWVTTIGSLGLVNSLMQQVSHHREKDDLQKLKLVKGTIFTSLCIFLCLLTVLSLISFRKLSLFFFDNTNPEFAVLVLIITLAVPLNVLASNYIEGFFTAYHRFDLYVKASSVVTVLSLIFFVPAVYFWKVQGGLISIISGEVLIFFVFLYYVLKIEKFKNVFIFRFNPGIFYLTFRDGIVNLSCACLAAFIGLLLRQMVIKESGIYLNGIYQFCLSITAYYTPFLTNLLWAKYFPSISARKITDETKEIVRSTLIFVVLSGALITAGILIFSDEVIRILATKDFTIAEKYLPIQFMGDFWYFIFYLYSVFLLAMRSMKRYLLIWMFFLAVQYLLSTLLVSYWGLNGIIAGYLFAAMLTGLFSLYAFTTVIGRMITKVYYVVFISFSFVVMESVFTIMNVHMALKLLLLIVWIYWFARPMIRPKNSFNG